MSEETNKIIKEVKDNGFGFGWFLLIILFCAKCGNEATISTTQMNEIKQACQR